MPGLKTQTHEHTWRELVGIVNKGNGIYAYLPQFSFPESHVPLYCVIPYTFYPLRVVGQASLVAITAANLAIMKVPVQPSAHTRTIFLTISQQEYIKTS